MCFPLSASLRPNERGGGRQPQHLFQGNIASAPLENENAAGFKYSEAFMEPGFQILFPSLTDKRPVLKTQPRFLPCERVRWVKDNKAEARVFEGHASEVGDDIRVNR